MSRRAKLTALWGSVAAAGWAMVYSFSTDYAHFWNLPPASANVDASVIFGFIGTVWLLPGLAVSTWCSTGNCEPANKPKRTPPPTWEQTAALAREYDLRMPHTYYEDISAGRAEDIAAGRAEPEPERVQTYRFDEWQSHPDLGVDVRVVASDPMGAVQVRRSESPNVDWRKLRREVTASLRRNIEEADIRVYGAPTFHTCPGCECPECRTIKRYPL